MNPIVDVAVGALLLVLGRKLFWLFVAIAGFYFGAEVARAAFAGQADWVVWTIAIGAGLIGAVLAMLVQRLGFALAGFYAGGYVALIAAERFAPGSFAVAAFVLGGVVGAVLAAVLMDWGIIVVSCLLGAALIVAALGLQPLWSALVFAALAVLGGAVQAQLMGGTSRAPARRSG